MISCHTYRKHRLGFKVMTLAFSFSSSFDAAASPGWCELGHFDGGPWQVPSGAAVAGWGHLPAQQSSGEHLRREEAERTVSKTHSESHSQSTLVRLVSKVKSLHLSF